MAGDNQATGVLSMAGDWDMPSVTSVYASPLFRREFEPINLPGYGGVGDGQQGTHPVFVMSDDFVFPPNEHENFPVEPEHDESNNNNNSKESSCVGDSDSDWCHVQHEEVDAISDDNLFADSDLAASNETTLPDLTPPEIDAKQEKDQTTYKTDLPCEGWWKSKSTFLLDHIKGVTIVCSVVAAGAVVGFVVMGQRWQQDKWHFHQIRVSSESLSRVIGILSLLKDGLPGSQQLKSMVPTRILPQQPLSA